MRLRSSAKSISTSSSMKFNGRQTEDTRATTAEVTEFTPCEDKMASAAIQESGK